MLSLSQISVRFGATLALDDVSFDVGAGEVHALLGENGAGKTTLMRVAHGALVPDRGEVVVEREKGEGRRKKGVGMVHQHFTSIPSFTVAENIALVAGWRGGGRQHVNRARKVIDRLGMPLDAEALTGSLSVQLRQRLEIVQALASGAQVLLLDEPTAVLAPRETAELLRLVRDLADGGSAVVLITHKLVEALQVADRITVLRGGRITATGPASGFDASSLSRAMIGSGDLSIEELAATHSARGRELVRVGELSFRAGEVVGVAAIEGNGQRELLRTIAGVEAARNDVSVAGSVALVPEDRTTEALIAEFPLSANLLLGNLDTAPRWIDWRGVEAETGALITRSDIRASGPGAAAGSLSGGNQQKFILARALARRPDVLVVEEPSRGLDLHATRVVRSALQGAARQGACVVLHSSDLDEVLELADRLLVMVNGQAREIPVETSRDQVGDAMLGMA